MAYSESQINNAVSTVHMNSRRQAKRALVTNYANGDINFIGKCCFAYSGQIDCDGGATNPTLADTTNYLQFNSGPNFLEVDVQWGNTQTSGTADNFVVIGINDIVVYSFRAREGAESNFTNPKSLHLIIPPFSDVKCNADTSADPHTWTMSLTGKVYAGAEIIQGAI